MTMSNDLLREMGHDVKCESRQYAGMPVEPMTFTKRFKRVFMGFAAVTIAAMTCLL